MSNVIILTSRVAASRDANVLLLPLTAEERTKFRGRRSTSCGREVLLQLPREGCLCPGEVLIGEDPGILVLVEAAKERLMIVRAGSYLELIRASYHLGNRHVNLELHDDELLLLEDKVISEMLDQMGLTVTYSTRPFYPEVGAYNKLHSHGHDL